MSTPISLRLFANKMKLALISKLYLPSIGGLEIAVNNLSKRLLKNGHRINIITQRIPSYVKSHELIDEVSVDRLSFSPTIVSPRLVFPMPINFIIKMILIGYAVCKMRWLFKNNRIEIVNVHYIAEDFEPSVLLTSYICKFKLIVSLQGFNLNMPPLISKRKGWFFYRILKRADYVTACSQSLLTDAQRRVPEIKHKCKVIPNGVDLVEFKYREKHKHPNPYIFSLANFHHYKGLDILIMAFKEVSEKYANVDLIIVGDGYLRENHQELAGLLGLKDKIIFLGQVSEREKIVELFNGCEFFVLPSRCEPFGIVNLEAMAAGKAIVATNNGGIPEVVRDGVNGILVKPQDDKVLAEGIMRLLEDTDLRNRLGENGRKMVSQYAWERITDEYLKVYHKVLNRGLSWALL